MTESAGLRVLVVDDNQDATSSLSMLLEMHGHEVRGAFDGPAGLKIAAEFRPHVVVLDIGLPEHDGYTVAAQLRALCGGAKTILVALTGYGQKSDLQKSREAGFDHHITKPLDFKDLAQILEGARPA